MITPEPTPASDAVNAAIAWTQTSDTKLEHYAALHPYLASPEERYIDCVHRILAAEVERLRDQLVAEKSRASSAELLAERYRAALTAAIRELERVDNVKDGHPLVSHNLMYNLRAALATPAAPAVTPTVEKSSKDLKLLGEIYTLMQSSSVKDQQAALIMVRDWINELADNAAADGKEL